jgi:CubicO group peptidase (beta-lactamase class C family)
VKALMDHFHVPGLAVAVVNGNSTFTKGYGTARFPSTPVTSKTLFYGGSTTKSFTAAALSLLVDNASHPAMKWTAPISTFIPDDFVLMDGYATQHVTLEDAASHRTGMPRHDLSVTGQYETVRDIVRSMRYLPLNKPLRTTWQYCNLMFVTLGHVVETVSGQKLKEFLKEHIWGPLNMTSTYLSLPDAQNGGILAQGYTWLQDSQEFMKIDHVNADPYGGAGAIISNVIDYAKYLRMMMTRGKPLSEEAHTAIGSPHMIMPDLGNGGIATYGYGWMIEYYRGSKLQFHSGAIHGVSL